MTAKKAAVKANSERAFLDALLHGVLVRKPFKVRVGDQMERFKAGDVISVTEAHIANPSKNEFVQTIANRSAGHSDGSARPGQSAVVFKTKAALDKAAKEFRAKLASGERAEAMREVEAKLSHLTAQGRRVASVASLDALLDDTISGYAKPVVDAIKARLAAELGLEDGK